MKADPGFEDLLFAAQQGDREVLNRLLAKNRERVYRYGLRVCRTSEDAEDAVQQTLWAVTRSIHAFRRAAAMSTWLFTIVRNYCLRLVGRERFYADLDVAVPSLSDSRPSAENELVSDELREILAKALSRLTPLHREVILFRDIEGLSAPEAAAALGISVAALKSRLHRAREELRAEVRRLAPPGVASDDRK